MSELRRLVGVALDAVDAGGKDRGGPAPAGDPIELHARWQAAIGEVLPADGIGADRALAELTRLFAAGSVDPTDPLCAAHLHCGPHPAAVAADLAASVLNPSLDSWDQAPFATTLEPLVLKALADAIGYPGSGVVTTGGSESNLLGLLLARERNGGGRVFRSAAGHFSVDRAAWLLGLGRDAVVTVPTDRGHRMSPQALDQALRAAKGKVTAVVATAGTTDLGAVDPLNEIAEVAAAHGAWLHVDAAYGGGALFSENLAPLLAGLEKADSIALDLHKLGWQPVAAGIFLARDGMTALDQQADYLNPDDDTALGYTSLLGQSLRTTRRPDVLKIAVTMKALGRRGLGAYVDRCHQLATYAAGELARLGAEVYQPPVLSTVVFRTGGDDAGLRRRLLASGQAVIGRTTIDGATWLKLTLLNPATTEADVRRLVALACGAITGSTPAIAPHGSARGAIAGVSPAIAPQEG